MRPEEIRAQISSLNDELKDTLKEVNAYHSERDLLLKQIGELKFNKTEAERLYREEKARLASIRYPQEQEIKSLNERIDTKKGEINNLESRISKLDLSDKEYRRKSAELIENQDSIKSTIDILELKKLSLINENETLVNKRERLDDDIRMLGDTRNLAEKGLFEISQREQSVRKREIEQEQEREALKLREKRLSDKEENLYDFKKELDERQDIIRRDQGLAKNLVKAIICKLGSIHE